jgi:hypothetical protein
MVVMSSSGVIGPRCCCHTPEISCTLTPAVVRRQRRNIRALQADVTRLAHLQPRRQIDPQLQHFERAALFLELRRGGFGMHEAAAGGHPLHAARSDHAFMAAAVAVRDVAFENEGQGFKAAMRMRAER